MGFAALNLKNSLQPSSPSSRNTIQMPEILQVRNPRNGEFDYEIELSSNEQIAAIALDLRTQQVAWRDSGISTRITVIREWQAALNKHSDTIIAALSVDTGRTAIAKGEFFGLLGMIDRWCTLAPSLLEERTRASVAMPDVTIHEQLQPYPLLGAISPWNFPLLLSFIDAVPALLAGTAVIVKPSEVTPRFAAAVTASIADVPELENVVRFISGDGRAGAELIKHVDVVAFTGSVATGRKVAIAAAEAFIPVFLELGGKDPVVLLENSPLERAATAVLRASVSATGQACQSLERIYVNDTQHDEFVALLSQKASASKLSYPDPDQGVTGPLIFERQAEIIQNHLEDAVAKGATIETGGEIFDHGGGKWIAPTVLVNVDHSMQVMTEETFGPVMPVMRYSTEAEALQLANDSQYGLSGAVFAGDDAAAMRFARQMNVGGVSINDAGMTTMIFEACKSAFNLSGMGPSRMGPTGLTRFFRQKALYHNHGETLPLESLAEAPPG
jgi:succinate-semialdehyde dehydrogenase/glutarate-semialdehyde dehydrogenase